ncbi:MAG: hypothetical protein JXI43_14445 [Tissierellales bacterium]|nr:hypothetical protein [Tissierellales bacterium]
MPFNLLVTTCACHSQKVRYEPREGAHITIDTKENEHVIFFEIDEQSNKTSLFRKHFSMLSEGQKICDLLIYYYLESSVCDVRKEPKIICLAESKGSSLDDAIEQIENTFNHIKTKFSDLKGYNNPIVWCAYIATSGFGSSQNLRRKEYRKKMKQISGIKYSSASTEQDIGKFLRNCYSRLESEKEATGKILLT